MFSQTQRGIKAVRAFGEHSKIYLVSGETFDVEDTVGKIVEIVRS